MTPSASAGVSGASEGDAALAAGLARWLLVRRELADVYVGDLTRPVAGYSSQTVFAEAAWRDHRGTHADNLVIRMPPQGAGLFADYDLGPQWQAQRAAARVGVPVPDPVFEADAGFLGTPFILMPRMDGHIIGPLAHLDPWLSGRSPAERALVHDGFLSTVAAVQRADPDDAPDVPRRDNGAELDHWEEYLSWSAHGHPVPTLADALGWCRRHRPDSEPTAALLWGDVRFENMVLDDDLKPLAVLDWDMTMVGAPEHDLAWFTSLDLTAHAMFNTRAEGFPDRLATVARFEELIGREVRDLEWYETLAMLRSSAIMTRISILRRDAGKSPMLPIEDNPILDLLRARLV
jgi:aminoglycoside phosphotransferase (APT) family kinase protein